MVRRERKKKRKEKQRALLSTRSCTPRTRTFNASPNSPPAFSLLFQPFYHHFHFSLSLSSQSFNHSSSSYCRKVEQGLMECVQGALKSSSRQDLSVKTTQQSAILDDLWVVNGQTAVSGDDFFVDDLLDFSNGFVEEGVENELQGKDNNVGCSSASPKQGLNGGNNSNHSTIVTVSAVDNFCSLHGSDLSVPDEDMVNLEWLSHFVEDSFSGYPLTYPAGKLAERQQEKRSQPAITVETKPLFTIPIQTKTRSKRTRTGGRICSFGSLSLTESSTTSSSSSSTTSSPSSNPWLIYANPSEMAESVLGKLPAKKQKKKAYAEYVGGGRVAASQPRRCSHCGVQKTPQWRAGPLGAKTL